MTDKKTIRIVSASVFAALLLALLLPLGESGRIVAAILLLPAVVLVPLIIKKREILSINKKAPVGNEFWGLYTSDTELSNTAWGTATYEGNTYGSAMFGAEDLPVIENGIYIWQISTF